MAGFDPTQNVVTDWLTMHEILEKQRAHPKGRQGLSIRCSARLRRWCLDEKREGGRSPGQGTGPLYVPVGRRAAVAG
jgi:hypothetical protein